MPVPLSARFVSRASKVQRKSRTSSAAGGMPRSRSVWLRIDFTVGSAIRPARTGFGTTFVRLASIRIANCGACAAFANSLSASPTDIGSGLTRWKVSPGRSSSGRWAMWSIALATKSTGTMLVCPPSGPASGTHSGSEVAQLLEQLEEVVRARRSCPSRRSPSGRRRSRGGRRAASPRSARARAVSDSYFVAW